jgi:hypothetical protein
VDLARISKLVGGKRGKMERENRKVKREKRKEKTGNRKEKKEKEKRHTNFLSSASPRLQSRNPGTASVNSFKYFVLGLIQAQ